MFGGCSGGRGWGGLVSGRLFFRWRLGGCAGTGPFLRICRSRCFSRSLSVRCSPGWSRGL